MQQIYQIVKPVICCILLSILWVKISMAGSDFRPRRSSIVTVYYESDGDSTGDRFVGSLQNALIIMAQVIGATILFVCLFKYGCFKVSTWGEFTLDFFRSSLDISSLPSPFYSGSWDTFWS